MVEGAHCNLVATRWVAYQHRSLKRARAVRAALRPRTEPRRPAPVAQAQRRRGVTGILLIQLLEMRLDNIVYRMGFSNTRAGARQFVNHGHVLVNGQRVDIASYNTKPGDKISVRDNPRSKQLALRGLDLTQAISQAEWLVVDRDNLEGTISRVPERDEVDPMVNEQLVVELYSR